MSKIFCTFAAGLGKKVYTAMRNVERQENAAIGRLNGSSQSAAYRSARRANIPVTVLRKDTIYRVTNESSVVIGKVEPTVKVVQRVVTLK